MTMTMTTTTAQTADTFTPIANGTRVLYSVYHEGACHGDWGTVVAWDGFAYTVKPDHRETLVRSMRWDVMTQEQYTALLAG